MSLKIYHHVNPHFHHPDLRPVQSLNQASGDEAENTSVQTEKQFDDAAKRKFDEYFAEYFPDVEASHPSKRHQKEKDAQTVPNSQNTSSSSMPEIDIEH
jgi:hypothetical protein